MYDMNLLKIYDVESREEDLDFAEAETVALKMLGLHRYQVERTQVPFHFGSQLLHAVYRDFYSGMELEPKKASTRYWMSDDFYQYIHNNTNQPVLYLHFAHGDCDLTFFRIANS